MAELIEPQTFAELEVIAASLLDKARESSAGHIIVTAGAPAEEVILTEEVQACANAFMALCRVTPLEPQALFVAMGAAVGVILAQTVAPHAALLKLMRTQEKASYDEVIRAATPPTRTMQ